MKKSSSLRGCVHLGAAVAGKCVGVGNASPGPEALRRHEDRACPVLTAHRGEGGGGWLPPCVGLVPPEGSCLPRATPARAAAASTAGSGLGTPLANTLSWPGAQCQQHAWNSSTCPSPVSLGRAPRWGRGRKGKGTLNCPRDSQTSTGKRGAEWIPPAP